LLRRRPPPPAAGAGSAPLSANSSTAPKLTPHHPPHHPPHTHTQIYDLETEYFIAEYAQFGNALKGYDGYLTSKSAAARNKNRVFRLQDRGFSLSSYTSPATRELQDERSQFAAEAAYGGGRAGGVPGGLPPSRLGRY
jgi:hypothetical protein